MQENKDTEKTSTFTATLSNGLRLVHVPGNGNVAYCGVAVNVGSRDDAPGHYGMAHFVEHTIFKGTSHRSAWHIINRMESVGGELNAYTTKEGTVVYSVMPKDYLDRATELIADLVTNSVFPEVQLNREREVVMDEVDSYRDTPSEAVYDDWEDKFFAGSELGHNILGNEHDLESISGEDCRNYLLQHYVPENMVYFVYGDIPSKKALRLAERYFLPIEQRALVRPARVMPAEVAPFRESINIGSHQCHTVLGTRLFDMRDDRRYAMALLNNMLGGPGMNSLLNVQLRERRGMVYAVESNVSLMSDCGMFQVYFGCDSHHVDPCMRIVGDVINRLAEQPLTARHLDAVKRQYAGQLLVASSSGEALALSAAKSMLYFGRVITERETMQRIEAVTPEEMMQAAQMLVPSRWSTLTFHG